VGVFGLLKNSMCLYVSTVDLLLFEYLYASSLPSQSEPQIAQSVLLLNSQTHVHKPRVLNVVCIKEIKAKIYLIHLSCCLSEWKQGIQLYYWLSTDFVNNFSSGFFHFSVYDLAAWCLVSEEAQHQLQHCYYYYSTWLFCVTIYCWNRAHTSVHTIVLEISL